MAIFEIRQCTVVKGIIFWTLRWRIKWVEAGIGEMGNVIGDNRRAPC